MLTSVLVANRGEIALRIYRACHELGIRAIAVYSDADRDAPWLRHADEAHLLGPAEPAASYLSIARLLEIAEAADVDAIHPGYGFLSENAELARRVVEAGFVWVGPPAEAMARMGDKVAARATARAADCPVVPGTADPVDELEVVRAFADEHGYPVLLKAAHGGGGRGQKIVTAPADLADGLSAAAREAAAAFGRGEVYVERYLPRARHVEVQLLADAHGRVLHLGERDCSTQRRHQKLIEEAPAPGLHEGMRQAMTAAAVRIGELVGYTGAGTCEFLCNDEGFWFLEMNTRLQVEHPVTELVTGVDLVQWQLRVAAGEQLPWRQEDIVLRGHAIEARINVEDPSLGFAPSPGLITEWEPPAGPGIRLDAAGGAGWTIPGAYDSLIAKLVAHGPDRDSARRRLLRACDEFVVRGVPTTLDFHRFALTTDDFVAGRVTTVSVERDWDLSVLPPPDHPTPGPAPAEGRTFVVEVGGKRIQVRLYGNEATGPATGRRPPPRPAATRRGRDPSAGGCVAAPLQGTIVKVAVEPGQSVATGDVLVVLEAMKMENTITAEHDGVVTAVLVTPGEVVAAGATMVELSPPAHDPGEPDAAAAQ